MRLDLRVADGEAEVRVGRDVNGASEESDGLRRLLLLWGA